MLISEVCQSIEMLCLKIANVVVGLALPYYKKYKFIFEFQFDKRCDYHKQFKQKQHPVITSLGGRQTHVMMTITVTTELELVVAAG
jgi:hypothetical protein